MKTHKTHRDIEKSSETMKIAKNDAFSSILLLFPYPSEFSRLQAQLSRSTFPPAVSRILGVRSVTEKHDFTDFQITFFGVAQAPREPTTGFLRATRVSRKDPGEFLSVIPDVAHQGALDLCYIIENS